MRASLVDSTGATLSSAGYEPGPSTSLTFDGFTGSAVAIRLGEYVVTAAGEVTTPLGLVPLRAPITMVGAGRVDARVAMTVLS